MTLLSVQCCVVKESATSGDTVVSLRGTVTLRVSLDGHRLCTGWPVKLSAEANMQTRHASRTGESEWILPLFFFF